MSTQKMLQRTRQTLFITVISIVSLGPAFAKDLTSPLSITLPDPKGRYQSLMVVSEDHSISVFYGPQKVTLTQESVGTRYVMLPIRTFMDPNDEADMKGAHQLQDEVRTQQVDIGKFEVPDWGVLPYTSGVTPSSPTS